MHCSFGADVVMRERWKNWVVPPSLAVALSLTAACSESNSAPGGGDAGALTPDSSTSDAAYASDASACRGFPQGQEAPDKEVAALCAQISAMPTLPFDVMLGTKECGGVLAVFEREGTDQGGLWLFDAKTRVLVESVLGVDGTWTCNGSVNGVDLTTGQAASCMAWDWWPSGGGGWGFQLACPSDDGGAPDGPSDAPTQDASSDASSD